MPKEGKFNLSTIDLSNCQEMREEAYMDKNEDGMDARQIDVGHQQLSIITQLLQMSVTMCHIDEMFLWLSHSIGLRLNVPIIQLWANQAYTTGQSSAELRVTASQDPLFPLQVVNNEQVAEVVRDLFTQQSGVSPQSVESAFSPYQADLLARYNLRYWASLFLSSNALLLPPMSNDLSRGAISTPVMLVVSLFTPQVLDPKFLPAIKHILEYALSIAKNRGLLSSVAHPSLGNSANNREQPQQVTRQQLIPHWKQDIQAMQASNPLANATPITNKRARQLYFAIDGKKSITELADIMRLDQEEVDSALQFLLEQRLIQLHEPGGKAVTTPYG
jgi:hypothetical protein